MINQISLQTGSVPGAENLVVNTGSMTIFIGPNNSGKSKAITEILTFRHTTGNDQQWSGFLPQSDHIIRNVVFDSPTLEDIKRDLDTSSGLSNAYTNVNKAQFGGPLSTNDAEDILSYFIGPNNSRYEYFFDKYIYSLAVKLDGKNRLTLLDDKETGNLLDPPTNNLNYLLRNDAIRQQIRSIVYEAFGKYFVIDPTNSGKLSVKLSDTNPTAEIERSFTDASLEFFRSATPFYQVSDGVKAFCGIIAAIIGGNPKLIMIDEPEAFLHPSLSNFLGKEIGKYLKASTTGQKKVFVATHSANFLMGCIQSNVQINIIRLTYKGNIATARLLPEDKILHLMRNPLLRSTGILEGLFYDAVIVTEADSDRAFYQEINERLLLAGDERGIFNCLFVNAQNKQTIWDIVKPLREMGIPTVGIVDIDVLKEGGTVFSKLIHGAFIPEISGNQLQTGREKLKSQFVKIETEIQKNMKKDGGIDLLAEGNRNSAVDFFDIMEKYGAFVVRKGELESWLPTLDISRNKSTWLTNIFEVMGENPAYANYVKPSDGDVWDFIGNIKKWINNPSRRGIPD